MKRFLLLFITIFATRGLHAQNKVAFDPQKKVRVFLAKKTEARNPISVDTTGSLTTLKLEDDALADFDIKTFTDQKTIRNVWGRDLDERATSLMDIFKENFNNYAKHHKGSYTGTVKIYDETQPRPNPTTTYATTFEVWEKDTLVAAQELLADKPAVLNMADDITPGGFLNSGGHAQEESISYRAHDMVIALMRSKQAVYGNSWHNVYQKTEHGPKFIQEKGAIYIPQVKVLRAPFNGKHYQPLAEDDQFSVDIIASVAYDLRWSRGKKIPADYEDITKEKIRTQLRVALNNDHTTILLSAYGCGCHCNKPKVIADFYKEIFNEPEFKGAFKKTVFSILGKENFTVFKNCFNGHKHDKEISTATLVAAGVGVGALALTADALIRKERSFFGRFYKLCTGNDKPARLTVTKQTTNFLV